MSHQGGWVGGGWVEGFLLLLALEYMPDVTSRYVYGWVWVGVGGVGVGRRQGPVGEPGPPCAHAGAREAPLEAEERASRGAALAPACVLGGPWPWLLLRPLSPSSSPPPRLGSTLCCLAVWPATGLPLSLLLSLPWSRSGPGTRAGWPWLLLRPCPWLVPLGLCYGVGH